MTSDIPLIFLLSFYTLLPFLVASGTCFIKFSIVFVMVRNALGLQQVPSNMTLNGISLMLAIFVMGPIVQQGYNHFKTANVDINNSESIEDYVETGVNDYRDYLQKYADPELVRFFEKIQESRIEKEGGSPTVDNRKYDENISERVSILSLLPAYALSEVKSAFKIGFYIYLPFVVVDLVISSILLALGMMMMSPITISTPIKLVLFVALDGWTILSKGLILQYIDLAS